MKNWSESRVEAVNDNLQSVAPAKELAPLAALNPSGNGNGHGSSNGHGAANGKGNRSLSRVSQSQAVSL